MEALERAGMELTPCAIEAVFITDEMERATFIIGRNDHRRHMTKQERAASIVAALKAAEEAEAKKGCKVCTVSAEPHKGGRGKVKPVKQKAIAIGKEQDIGKRTIQTALAKAEGKKPKPIRHRRTYAEIERDGLIRFADHIDHLPIPEPSDAALDLLPEAERDNAIEIVKRHLAGAKTLLDRLRISKAGVPAARR